MVLAEAKILRVENGTIKVKNKFLSLIILSPLYELMLCLISEYNNKCSSWKNDHCISDHCNSKSEIFWLLRYFPLSLRPLHTALVLNKCSRNPHMYFKVFSMYIKIAFTNWYSNWLDSKLHFFQQGIICSQSDGSVNCSQSISVENMIDPRRRAGPREKGAITTLQLQRHR